jgi:maltokinase
VEALNLPNGVRFELIPAGSGWRLELPGPGTVGEPELAAARWLVDTLAEAQPSSALDGGRFALHRFIRPEPPGNGERLITVDQTNRSVIVGESAVVKWLRRVEDAEHPALTALAHLTEVGFTGVPATFGALTWRTPGGIEVPLGIATAFLPAAIDGWQWCSPGSRGFPGFPAELGRLLAGLHAAFATPSSVLTAPVGAADDVTIRRWHADARRRLAEVIDRIGEVDDAAAGTDGDLPQRTPSVAIAEHRAAMTAAIDRLLAVPGPTPIQRTHADMHVGQVLRWAGGLAVIDFDGNPVVHGDRLLGGNSVLGDNPAIGGQTLGLANGVVQSPVRDLAQLLLSVDQVGRIADRRAGFSITTEINAWSRRARAELVAGYRSELADLGRPDDLDLRLLPTFLVEQACRDLLYAVRFLPRWAYATVDGLDLLLSDLPR